MNKLIFSLYILFVPTLVLAGSISGNVQDSQGGLPAGDVLLYSQSDTTKLLQNEMTDDEGNFSFQNVPLGHYLVKAVYIGYKDRKVNVTLSQAKPKIVSMTIKMQDDANMLQAVVVTAQRTSLKVEPDKKTFLVNASSVTEGVSVSDVLRDVPTVGVDVEGNISLRNNQNVTVYINGKPSGLTDDNMSDILEQLPANSIAKIEVITNPSSKYNAEGEAGIINIVLREDQTKGYYGSVTAGLNYPFDGELGGNVGASISYTSGKWNLTGSLGAQKRNMVGDRVRDRKMYRNGDTTFTKAVSDVDRDMTTGFLNLGASYRINKRNSVSAKVMGSLADRENNENYRYSYGSILDGKREADSYSFSNNTVESDRKVFSSTVDYTHNFLREGMDLNIAASFAANHGTNDAVYDMGDLDLLRQLVDGSSLVQLESEDRKMRQTTVQADFSLPFEDAGKMEIGLKADLQNNENDSHTKEKKSDASSFVSRSELANEFEIQQNIYSAYVNYSDNLSTKIKYNLGLRGELTDMDWTQHVSGDKSSKDPYLNFFPSAFISYSLTAKDELQVNYTRRVTRPRMRRLNPYINVSDSSNVSFGNPDLDPELTHSVEFNYVRTVNDNLYTASVYYKNTKDVVSQYSWTEGSILKTTYGNMSHAQQVGLELIAKQKIAKPVTITANVNVYYYKLEGGWFDINVTDSNNMINTQSVHLDANKSFSWTGKLNADVMLPWDLSAQLSADYTSPMVFSQGRNRHIFTSNIGFKRSFFNKKLTATLSCRDLFDSFKMKRHTYSDYFDQQNEFRRSGRTLLLNLSYNFGSIGSSKSKKELEQENSGEESDDLSFFQLTPDLLKSLNDDSLGLSDL